MEKYDLGAQEALELKEKERDMELKEKALQDSFKPTYEKSNEELDELL